MEHKRNMNYSNRARSGQQRLLNTRGVRDLREVLDKKRSEKEGAQQPSADPNCDLNDSAYEQNVKRQPQSPNRQYYKTKHFTQSWQNRPKYQQKARPPQQNQDIENPCNIKIEFSTTSGQHTYTLDENVKLPTIKHVPDRRVTTRRNNNYEWQRGGGRKRYVNKRKYHPNNDKNDENDKTVDESKETNDETIVEQLKNVDLNQDGEQVEGDDGGSGVEEEEEEVVDDEDVRNTEQRTGEVQDGKEGIKNDADANAN